MLLVKRHFLKISTVSVILLGLNQIIVENGIYSLKFNVKRPFVYELKNQLARKRTTWKKVKGVVSSKISRRCVEVDGLGETLLFTRTKSDKIWPRYWASNTTCSKHDFCPTLADLKSPVKLHYRLRHRTSPVMESGVVLRQRILCFQNMRNLHVWHAGTRSIFVGFCSGKKQCLSQAIYFHISNFWKIRFWTELPL